MLRRTVRLLLVVALVGLGWVAGRAQSAVSDFEIVVSAPAGSAEITCVRGSSITCAPTVQPAAGPADIHVPTASLRGSVAAGGLGCLAATWSPQNCRIWGWTRR